MSQATATAQPRTGTEDIAYPQLTIASLNAHNERNPGTSNPHLPVRQDARVTREQIEQIEAVQPECDDKPFSSAPVAPLGVSEPTSTLNKSISPQPDKLISSAHRSCLQAFTRLFDPFDDAGKIPQIIQDEVGRFNVWTNNAGAHRIGRVSLDYRLQEASKVKQMVIKLLEGLAKTLEEATTVVSGGTNIPEVLSSASDSSADSSDESSEMEIEREPASELEEYFLEITHIITCLYELSITIRNPSPRDRLEKSSKINISYFESYDIAHVSAKFPNAEEYLCTQFGRANTRRRQLLRYNEQHHKKIAGTYKTPDGVVMPSVIQQEPLVKEAGTSEARYHDVYDMHDSSIKHAHSLSTANKTQNTTITLFREQQAIAAPSEAGRSQTSFALSADCEKAVILDVPPPPNSTLAYDGNPFECPFCFAIERVSNEREWKSHVFRDLCPYSCTFQGCPKSNHLYDSRHDWFEHEMAMHRIEYYCNSCDASLISRTDFEDHLRQNHPEQPLTTVERCARPTKSKQQCPFCKRDCVPSQLQSHLARHMQQIALFAIGPTQEEASGDLDSNGARQHESEDHSQHSIRTIDSNPNPRDRIEWCSSIEAFDIQHVAEKFPLAARNGYLLSRLGKANTKRRELLKYHKIHHEKIFGGSDQALGYSGQIHIDSAGTVITGTNQPDTTTSTYVPLNDSNPLQSDTDALDTRSEGDFLNTSSASGTIHRRVPDPPEENAFDGKPLQCPYCCSLVTVKDRMAWIRHVFRDLRPYVCTFNDCLQAEYLFASRYEWFEHERALHRREWLCNICHQLFRSKEEFQQHLPSLHPGEFDPAQIHVLADRAERAIEPEQPCLLCGKAYSPRYLQNHLGRHLQQLALFVLPGSEEGDGSENDLEEDSVVSEELSTELLPEKDNAEDLQPSTAEPQAAMLAKPSGQALEEAGAQEESVVEEKKRELGSEHPGTLSAMQRLVNIYYKQGRWKKAEQVGLQVVETMKRVLGQEHPDTLSSMADLASTYKDQGRWKEAEELQVKVMETRKRVLGQEHPDTLSSMANLASTYSKQGRWKEAEELGVKVMETRKRVLGQDHPSTLTSMNNLAHTYKSQGRIDEAIALMAQVAALRSRIIGEDHPDTKSSMKALVQWRAV